jgi:hypothetical protein
VWCEWGVGVCGRSTGFETNESRKPEQCSKVKNASRCNRNKSNMNAGTPAVRMIL